jgi:hypothetical protein
MSPVEKLQKSVKQQAKDFLNRKVYDSSKKSSYKIPHVLSLQTRNFLKNHKGLKDLFCERCREKLYVGDEVILVRRWSENRSLIFHSGCYYEDRTTWANTK